MAAVGIDVAKKTLAVLILLGDGRQRQKHCANSPAGHAELVKWLGRYAPGPVPVGLEATGGYQDAVALALHEAGYAVSVLNPQVIAAYSQSQLRRAKTDPADAALIAHYVQTQAPAVWTPPPPELRQFQAWSGASMRCSRCGRRSSIAWSWRPPSSAPRSARPSSTSIAK